MEEKKVPFPKMKFTGYICLAFAAFITVIALYTTKTTITETMPAIQFWAGIGVTLLTVNAGKRIGGNLAAGKVLNDRQNINVNYEANK